MADNGGYSEGSFYGDPSIPSPAGYPRDGETFYTNRGVPFGHNDPEHLEEPAVEPVDMRPAVVASTPRPAAAPVRATTWPASAPAGGRGNEYAEGYPTGSVYGGDHGAEVAVVTPYVEPKPAPPPEPKTVKPVVAKVAASGTTRAATAKKPAQVAATGTSAKSGAAKPASAKSGATVKTAYTPPGKKAGASKPKATKVVRVHDIKPGDTLSKLASRYGVTVAELKNRNKLTSDKIVVGKRLTID